MINDFRTELKNRLILSDGAMGTMLQLKNLIPKGLLPESFNISEKIRHIKDIHSDYINAGSEIIVANTFGANKIKLAEYGLADKLYEVNFNAVKSVKEISGGAVLVAMSIGPTGKFIYPVGDMTFKESVEIYKEQIRAGIDAGADIIELGFPFSDPMADGKVIQRSYERALKNRISMEDAFNFIKRLKAYRDIPVIFFTYYNPVFVMGSKFAEDAADAGVDGVLVVDLPPEESDEFNKYIRKKKIYQIFLLTPTTGIDRMRYVLSYAKGFVYYVSVAGVTGARKNLPDEICSNVKNIQGISAIPVGVGFGISSGEQAKAIKEYADAVIIGSKIIQFIESNINDKSKILEKIAEFSHGITSCL